VIRIYELNFDLFDKRIKKRYFLQQIASSVFSVVSFKWIEVFYLAFQ